MDISSYLNPSLWLIEENAKKAFLSQFEQLAQHPPLAQTRAVIKAKKIHIEANEPRVFTGKKKKMLYSEFSESEEDGNYEEEGEVYGSIGIIYLRGAMVYEGNWCVKGTAEIIEEIKAFGQDPTIKGVMMVVDSPGGMVKGTEIFANVVRDFRKKYNKKIFAYVEGMACSAAMWAISGADKIILAETTSQVGSIGTMVTFTDWAEYEKMNGIKEVSVYASLSTQKNKAYKDAIAGNPELLQNNILNPTNLAFLSAIQANRGAKMSEQVKSLDLNTATVENTPAELKGRVYVGIEAQNIGLVDKIAKEGLDKELELMQSYEREAIMPATLTPPAIYQPDAPEAKKKVKYLNYNS